MPGRKGQGKLPPYRKFLADKAKNPKGAARKTAGRKSAPEIRKKGG